MDPEFADPEFGDPEFADPVIPDSLNEGNIPKVRTGIEYRKMDPINLLLDRDCLEDMACWVYANFRNSNQKVQFIPFKPD